MFRSLVRLAPVLRSGVRSYATDAPAASNKLQLNFVLPHQSLMSATEVQQVNLSTTDGEMGILANHVPTIAQLTPGVVEIMLEGQKSQKFFVSGGFAVVNPDSSLNINAVEAVPVDQLDFEAARRGVEDANRRLNATGASEQDKALAKIELEVYEAITVAQNKV